MKGFKNKTSVQIRFKDIDPLGHVNNANHLSYIEMARVNYFEEVVGSNINWASTGIILARVAVDYRMAIMLHDKVFVYTGCVKIGTKSFTLRSLIIKEQQGEEILLAETEAVLVCYDYTRKQTIPMPEQWKAAFEKYDGELLRASL